jgi:DNA-binding GntR family transcriptional regulator
MPKTNLVDKAHRAIKQLIITYQLKPGTTLSFDKLSNSLDMSQTPIREAMGRLWQEQFVERQGAKGYVVSSLDAVQIGEIYDLRIIIEVPAIRLATRLLDDKGLSGLAEMLQTVKSLAGEQRRAEIIELDRAFHAVILKQSGNRLLSEIGENILDRAYRVQNLNVLTSDRLFTVHEHHMEIFEALKKKDEKAAAGLMENHLVSAREFVLSRLKNDDDILCKLLT